MRDLFFWLPKLLDFVERPLEWVLLLLLVTHLFVWRRRERAARRTLLAATLLLAFLGWTAPPELVLQRLENAYQRSTRPLADFEGLLVLGGGLDSPSRARERGQTLLGPSAERVTTAVSLARANPRLKIVVTGYAGMGEPGELPEAEATARFFHEQGLPATEVLVEPTARNTAEIADNTKMLPGVDPARPWLLITSAWNMPRAFLSFRKAGWNVEPFPVDYLTGTSVRFSVYSVSRGANRWTVVLHELLGIGWYRLTGRL